MKVCRVCKKFLELNLFPRKHTNTDGRKGTCKGCFSIYGKARPPELFPKKSSMQLLAESQARRKLLLQASVRHHSEDEWDTLKTFYGNRCLRCGVLERITKDHVVPLYLGGTNGIENLQPLCHPCNSQKQARIIDYRPNKILLPSPLI